MSSSAKKSKLSVGPLRRSKRLNTVNEDVENVDPLGSQSSELFHKVPKSVKKPGKGSKKNNVIADISNEIVINSDNAEDHVSINVPINDEHIKELADPTAWLDDVLIIELIRQRIITNSSTAILIDPVVWQPGYRSPEYWGPTKIKNRVILPTFPAFRESWEIAFVPTFVNRNHWIIAVIYKNSPRIVYYDTRHKLPSPETLSTWSNIGFILTNKILTPTKGLNCPHQFDSYSCGAMICMIAEKLFAEESTLFKNNVVYEWRRDAAKFLESQFSKTCPLESRTAKPTSPEPPKPSSKKPTIAHSTSPEPPSKKPIIANSISPEPPKPSSKKPTIAKPISPEPPSKKPIIANSTSPEPPKPSSKKPTIAKPISPEPPKPSSKKPTIANSTSPEPPKPSSKKPTIAHSTSPKPPSKKPTIANSTSPEPPKPSSKKPTIAKPISPEPPKPSSKKPTIAHSTSPEPPSKKPTIAKPISAEPPSKKPIIANSTSPEPPKPPSKKPTIANCISTESPNPKNPTVETDKEESSDSEATVETDFDGFSDSDFEKFDSLPRCTQFRLNTSSDVDQSINHSLDHSDDAEKDGDAKITRGKIGAITLTYSWSVESDLEDIKKLHNLSSKGRPRQTKASGMKQSFECSRKRTHGCKVTATVNFNGSKSTVIVRNNHCHDKEVSSSVGVSEAVRKLVKERMKTNESVAPLTIRKLLRRDNVPEKEISSISSIRNYTAYQKRLTFGEFKIGHDFIEYMESLRVKENDSDFEVGTIAYDLLSIGNQNHFFAILSSRHLLSQFREQRQIGIDATYKICHNGYPVIIIGFSDESHKYHPSAVAFVSVENTVLYENVFEVVCGSSEFLEIMADGAMCIKRAAANIVPDAFLRMCIFHLEQRLNNQMVKKGLSIDEQQLARNDINIWKNCTTEATAKAVQMQVLSSWLMEPSMQLFAEYMKREWVDGRPNWFNYEGGGPSTNNGNESTNRTLKMSYTFRRQASIPESVEAVKDYLNEFQRHPLKPWEPSMEDFVEARKLQEEHRQLIAFENKVIIPRKNNQFSFAEAETITTGYFSNNPEFDDIVKFLKSFYYVTNSNLYDNRCWCSCSAFRHYHKCKHALLIEINRKYKSWPEGMRRRIAPVSSRRGRGRGALAKKALER